MLMGIALAVGGLTSGCGRNGLPSERAVYRNAGAALAEHEALAGKGPLAPIDDCAIYVAKNSARIDIPLPTDLRAEGLNGDRATVWMKRVARRWDAYRIVLPAHLEPAG